MTHEKLLTVACGLTLLACSSGGGATAASRSKIPQVSVANLPVAPDSKRVDLIEPIFSHPTRITNPLFPVGMLGSVLLLGKSALRVEVTLLPGTRAIDWNGASVRTLITQHAAYQNGRLAEVAVDWYAQDDDGAVWRFGEDVTNYENGVVKDNEGSWLGGRDGPAAMIMPAHPRSGDVWRPQNIPGTALEEVTVRRVDDTMPGPRGAVTGIVDTEQLSLDGRREPKAYAPGYGEFSTDPEAVVLAAPTDAVAAPPPTNIPGAALATYDAVLAGNWSLAAATLTKFTDAWRRYPAPPPGLTSVLTAALDGLRAEISAKNPVAAARSALDVALPGLDLLLRHRPVTEVDRGRFGIHLRHLALDLAAATRDVLTEVTTLEVIRDRFIEAVPADTRNRVNLCLKDLRAAADAHDYPRAATSTIQLRALVP